MHNIRNLTIFNQVQLEKEIDKKQHFLFMDKYSLSKISLFVIYFQLLTKYMIFIASLVWVCVCVFMRMILWTLCIMGFPHFMVKSLTISGTCPLLLICFCATYLFIDINCPHKFDTQFPLRRVYLCWWPLQLRGMGSVGWTVLHGC